MRISKDWISQWASLPQHWVQKMCQHSVETIAESNPVVVDQKVLVGKVLSVEPHPEADRLKVTTVDINQSEPLNIVCGCPSVAPDMIVPVATIGAVLPGGKIKKAKLRNVPSQGMLCSLQDLGFEEQSDGLYPISGDVEIGQPFADHIGQSDQRYEFEITPNRGDCFSALGIAREVAAVYSQNIPQLSPPSRSIKQVSMDRSKACSAFAQIHLTNIKKGKTPLAITMRLLASGISPVHPIVDILNYVMLDIGQPMHAYDNDKISGKLSVKDLDQDKDILDLQGNTIKLEKDDCVIVDEDGIQALGGIIGAECSKVTTDTQSVILEAAHFDMDKVRSTSNRLGLVTDSSTRFARYVDPALTVFAIDRAANLICEHLGASSDNEISLCADSIDDVAIELSTEQVNDTLGSHLTTEECVDYLQRIGCQCVVSDHITVTVPSYRKADLRYSHDLIEEIIRLHGFDALDEATTDEAIYADTPYFLQYQDHVRRQLAAKNYNECVSYAFISKDQIKLFDYDDDQLVTVTNPVSSDYEVMRQGLLSSLLSICQFNRSYDAKDVALFEVGKAYFRSHETHQLALLKTYTQDTTSETAFKELSRDMISALQMPHGEVKFNQSQHKGMHPGVCADIIYQGQMIGFIGQIHPELAVAQQLPKLTLMAEVVLTQYSYCQQFKKFSKYPKITRDFAYIVHKNVNFGQIEAAVAGLRIKYLKDIQVFDIYRVEGQFDQCSYGVRFTFSHLDKSLTDKEIDKATSAINDLLKKQFDIQVR